MDLRRYFSLLVSRWWIVTLMALVCAGAAYALSTYVLPKEYTAAASFEVNIPATTQSGVNFNTPALVATEAQLATSIPVARDALQSLGMQRTMTARQLLNRTSCVPSDIAQSFTCTLTYSNRATATQLLDALGRFAVARNNSNQAVQLSPLIKEVANNIQVVQADLSAAERQLTESRSGSTPYALQARISADNSQLTNLQRQLLQLQQTAAAQSSSIIPLNPAETPTTPSSPKPLLDTIIAALLGVMIGVSTVLVTYNLTDPVEGAEHAAREVGAPILGAIPQSPRKNGLQLDVLATPGSATAEAYRLLRTNIQFASVDSPLRTILVTSSLENDGKTTVAANLAVTMAQFGSRVVLIDADTRRPMLHTIFELDNTRGLTTLLVTGVDDTWFSASQPTLVPSLRVLTAGPRPPNPAEMLSSRRMHALLETLKTQADIIILDSPPAPAVADSLALAAMVDGVVLVADTERWKLHTLRQGRQALRLVGARISGLVLNKVPRARGSYYRYYQQAPTPPDERAAVGGDQASLPPTALPRR